MEGVLIFRLFEGKTMYYYFMSNQALMGELCQWQPEKGILELMSIQWSLCDQDETIYIIDPE